MDELKQRVADLRGTVDSLSSKLEEQALHLALQNQRLEALERNTVHKAEYTLVKMIAFGFVGTSMLALVGKIIQGALQ